MAASLLVHGLLLSFLVLSVDELAPTAAQRPIVLELVPWEVVRQPPEVEPAPEPTPEPRPSEPLPAPEPRPDPRPEPAPTPAPAPAAQAAPTPRPQAPAVVTPEAEARARAEAEARARAEAQRQAEARRQALERFQRERASGRPIPAPPAIARGLPQLPGAVRAPPAPPSETAAAPGPATPQRSGDRWRIPVGPPMDERTRAALRLGVGCPDANRIGMTLAEREACERREARVAEANAPDLGANPVSQAFGAGLADRDCRRLSHSSDHASTYGLGSSERTRGGVTSVPSCGGTVLRNVPRVLDAIRGREQQPR